MNDHILKVEALEKYYGSFHALKSVEMEVRKGEIFGLLGPNGAGKTTLINIVCGIVTPTGGEVLVDGDSIIADFRQTRSKIGLVPQELPTETFETVRNTLRSAFDGDSVDAALASADVDPSARPATVTLSAFGELAAHLPVG